jgi:hypothetical protein
MQSSKAANDEAQHLLRKMLMLRGSEIAASHQWVSEAERWKELVFALLTRTTSLPQVTVRVVTDTLFHLDLLRVSSLSGIRKGRPPAPDFNDPHSQRIIQLMLDGGFTHEEARKGVTAVCEAAAALATRFSGKIQCYLRSYGERMLEEAPAMFQFSQMDRQTVRSAITFWLQNVLNMPLSLQDKSVESFSRDNGLTSAQCFQAADDLDINVAVIDDLLQHFHFTSEMARATPTGSDVEARRGEPKRTRMPGRRHSEKTPRVLPKR